MSGESRRTGPSNNQKIAWKKELDSLEREIAELERKQAGLNAQLGDPATYEDKVRSMAIAAEQREVAALLSSRLSRWEEVSLLLG